MKKRILSLALVFATMASLTGCGDTDTINELNSISALNSESSVTNNYNLSYSDEQEMIYAQVSNRQLLDLSALSACSDNEIQQVVNYMNLIDNQLVGKVKVVDYESKVEKSASEGLVIDDAVVDTKLTDYLLTFMEKTPYYWQRTKTTVRGIDPSSRSIVVDVTYKTLGFEKEVKKDSTIVLGDPNYDTLIRSRYTKWLAILSAEYTDKSNPQIPIWKHDFEQYWGDPNEIIESQNQYKPTTTIYNTGNQKTYSGLLDSPAEQSGGSMTVRYILVPEYVLGINLGVECKHMYVIDYKLDNDITEGLSSFTKEGYQTVTDNVFELIHSYFTAIDESDYNGLYKLTNNFETLDKYYQDVFESTYQKHDGYSISLFDITGTHISCGVTISTKERAKNSNMTLPVYTDRYYVELELVDDTLKVDQLVLLSRRLEGEPAITEDEVEDTGFTAKIDLDNDDKVAIENLICNFSAIQLQGDTTSDAFSNCVDTSITTNQLSALKTAMTSLSGARKVVFLQNYQQGTSNYASVRCKELYQAENNTIVEASSTYEFIVKGGVWYVYNYKVHSSVEIDTTNLQTTGSLCLVTPGKIESYTSQIKGSSSTNIDEVSDISVSFDHKSYTPVLKNGIQEQGKVLVTAATVEESHYDIVSGLLGSDYSDLVSLQNDCNTISSVLSSIGGGSVDVRNAMFSGIAVYINKAQSNYSDGIAENEAVTDAESTLETYRELVQQASDAGADRDMVKRICNVMQTVSISLR